MQSFFRCPWARWGLLLLTVVVTSPAWAILDLFVQENLVVYDRPSRRSKVISQLGRGDRVVISPKKYGRFRKVLVTYQGKRRGGYILAKSMRTSYIEKRGNKKMEGKTLYKKDSGLGLSLVFSHLRQGERTFELGTGDTYQVSTFESTTLFFSLFYDFPWGDTKAIRTYASFRTTEFKGSAQLVGAPSATPDISTVLEQNLLGVGAILKFYTKVDGSFWWGPAVEFGKGTSVGLKINDGIPLETTDEDLPFFVIVQGAAGWDISLPGGKMYLIPEIRAGFIPNTDPVTINGEVYLSFGYSL